MKQIKRTGAIVAAAAIAATGIAVLPANAKPAAKDGSSWTQDAYRGQVHVVPGTDADTSVIRGTVFDDKNHNSIQDRNEKGLKGVKVSNGRDVVTTAKDGSYELSVDDNTTIFVTQPRGYQVPVDADNIAQFFYHHVPVGSPEMKFGGIAPTGPAPEAVNFPLSKSPLTNKGKQRCLIGGDLQTTNAEEVEFARQGAFADLAHRTDYAGCGILFIGDIANNDLSIYDDVRGLMSTLNGPARFLPGNHDLDFEAREREHSTDTFRREFGPAYHSYDAGNAHVIALNTIEYPVGERGYRGSIDPEQMEWLRNDLAATPKNKPIIIAGHIPLLTFTLEPLKDHQVEQVAEIHQMLEGREVISIGGHTHSLENLRKGDSLAGWEKLFGIGELPFTHITAGAISGNWYRGKVLPEGYPSAIMRNGAMPGVVSLDIVGRQIVDSYQVRDADPSYQMNLGMNSPRYREWFDTHRRPIGTGRAPAFENPLQVSKADLSGQTWLTTNFFMGSTGSAVKVSLDGARAVEAIRTQEMNGESVRRGAEWSDPVAMVDQMVNGGGYVADHSSHLWRFELPTDLAVGQHTAEVTATDVHGRSYTETITFEVVA